MARAGSNAQTAALDARIKAACRELKLPTVARLFATVCDEATRKQQTTREILAELFEAETEERMVRRVRRRLKEASFPRLKTIDTFDFDKAPDLPAATLHELLAGNYIDAAQGVIFVGDPGTGKSHLATALGIAACRQGRRVRFVTAANLVNDLVEAKDARALGSMVRRYTRYEVLLIDDLGYLPMANHEAELVFQILAERSERGSVIVTTNLPFSEFTKVFPDKRLCAAVLDRLTHNAHIIDTGNQTQRRPITAPSGTPKQRGRRNKGGRSGPRQTPSA
jgi:DNA replication protein DnaC